MNRRFVLVTPGSIDTGVGGAALRWRALREALHPDLTACVELGSAAFPPKSGASYYDRLYTSQNLETLLSLIGDLDATDVVLTGLESYKYVEGLNERTSTRTIFDLHNAESDLQKEISDALKRDPVSKFTKFYTEGAVAGIRAAESEAVLAAAEIWVTTRRDQQRIRQLYSVTNTPIRVVPNALTRGDIPPATVATKPERILFLGTTQYYPNTRAAAWIESEIAPLAWASGLKLPFFIAGAAESATPESSKHEQNITTILNPASTRPLLRGAISIVPLDLGGGSRYKILEAFAQGSPVISTTKGAEGLNIEHGRHLLIADSTVAFVQAITDLSTDLQLLQRLTSAAYRLVFSSHSTAASRQQILHPLCSP